MGSCFSPIINWISPIQLFSQGPLANLERVEISILYGKRKVGTSFLLCLSFVTKENRMGKKLTDIKEERRALLRKWNRRNKHGHRFPKD